MRLASDGTPDGNLSFSLTKGENDGKNLGMTIVNDGNIVTILVLCKHSSLLHIKFQAVTSKISF